MPKLKVFRTSTGFHDAYVAVPSQKAALEAWGVQGNLFAQGLAEQVTDEALMAEALAQPGVVIKKLRGTEAEHFAALGPLPGKRKPKPADETEPAPPPKPSKTKAPKPKPKPRPSRDALDAADAALEQAIADQKAAVAALDEQIEALRKERRRLEETHQRERVKLEKQAKRERTLYDTAMDRWRG
jgi:rubrerythrin